MKNYQKYFKGKKITVMGLGLLGRGIGVTKFLAENGADLIVTDLKTKEVLAPALKVLKGYKNIKYVLGEHRLEDFKDRYLIIKAAGVPLDSPYITEAKKNQIPIKMDASLLVELVPEITVIGVTGTRGKSTVTHLIFYIIEQYLRATKKDKRQVYLGGNVRDMATLPLITELKPKDILVLELDSWQLQGFGGSKISPHISVFTNLMPDHLNYYQGSMKLYFLDKKNIYAFQTKDDFLVAGKTVMPLIKKSGKVLAKMSGSAKIPSDWHPKLFGKHNLVNIGLAVSVGQILEIPTDLIKKAVEGFAGVSGRMEFIREWQGIKFYNDTTATVPEATMAGLEALTEFKRPIILIGGGNDKLLDYKQYGKVVPKLIKKLVLFPGNGSHKIKKVLPKSFKKNMIEVASMVEAVKEAVALASSGDTIVLSPGATSFGLFKNEYDRGDQFTALVKKLK